MESIALESIQLGVHADSWEESIRIAAEPLVGRGSIDQTYVERMVESVNRLGPYIAIMPGLALAHAAPGDGVMASDLSIARFDSDIEFHCDHDPVRIVMCLACTDSESHVARLQRIAEKLLDDGFLDSLMSAESPKAMYALLNG